MSKTEKHIEYYPNVQKKEVGTNKDGKDDKITTLYWENGPKKLTIKVKMMDYLLPGMKLEKRNMMVLLRMVNKMDYGLNGMRLDRRN